MNDVSNKSGQLGRRASRALRKVYPSEREVLLARVLLLVLDSAEVGEDLVASLEEVASPKGRG